MLGNLCSALTTVNRGTLGGWSNLARSDLMEFKQYKEHLDYSGPVIPF